ncbi:hypothetical protein [Ruegeria atlantica]|uniref:Uncharacterized protein n=1 Tax=Ruegeria atlantica TaxID=81569 RepID=A0A0P1E1S2_9RHOB|nr:hypothetical protein [Ruegeria atlantica]CUH42066.1 hypothetical protein RUM4293_00951 [Ruegeria atlantica]
MLELIGSDEAAKLRNDPKTVFSVENVYARKNDAGLFYIIDEEDVAEDAPVLMLFDGDTRDIMWAKPEDARIMARTLHDRVNELEFTIGSMGRDIYEARATANELNDIVARYREEYPKLEDAAGKRVGELLDQLEKLESRTDTFEVGRATGAATNKRRADERQQFLDENREAVLAEANGNYDDAAEIMHVRMTDWASRIAGQTAWAVSTIKNRL